MNYYDNQEYECSSPQKGLNFSLIQQDVPLCETIQIHKSYKDRFQTLPQTQLRYQNQQRYQNCFYSNEEYSDPIQHYSKQIYSPIIAQDKVKGQQKKKRKVNTIDVVDIGKYHQRSKCLKGDRYQTKNLCKHVYTQTTGHLKILQEVKKLNNDQFIHLDKFIKEKHRLSLESFSDLFKCKDIKQKCRDFYQSKLFVSKVLHSRTDFKSKLTVVKYLEKIRKMAIHQNARRWKD